MQNPDTNPKFNKEERGTGREQKAVAQSKIAIIVVVDQLRADYAANIYTTSLSDLAGRIGQQPEVSWADCIPTITETMHATIATGTFPVHHNIISDGFWDRTKQKYETIRATLKRSLSGSNFLPSGVLLITAYVYENGLPVYCVGGKLTPTYLLATASEATLRVFCDAEKGRSCIVQGRYLIDIKTFERHLKDVGLYYDPTCRKGTREHDEWVMKVAHEIIETRLASQGKGLLFVSLPALDYIGHRYGPGSAQVFEHLKYLFGELLARLQQSLDSLSMNDRLLVITGDHGCRKITKALVPDSYDDLFKWSWKELKVFSAESSRWEELEPITIPSDVVDCIEYAICDGGILRFWLKEPLALTTKTVSDWILEKEECEKIKGLKNFVDTVILVGEARAITPPVKDSNWIINSISPRLGDIAIVARGECAFYRRDWVYDRIGRSLREIPNGEHGTNNLEDSGVMFYTEKSGEQSGRRRHVDTYDHVRKYLVL